MAATNINPYAPPQSEFPIDFRNAAVEESLRIVARSGGRPIEDLGVSLVLPTEGSGAATLRWIGWSTLARLVLGILGVVFGGLLGVLSDHMLEQLPLNQAEVLWIGVSCVVGGLLLLLLNGMFTRATVRRGIGDRYARVWQFNTTHRPLCSGVEDARTFQKIKLLPEDLAWIAFDAAGKRLILEGLLYRYVIHAGDVLLASEVQGPTSTGVQIVFRVGEVVIGITLQMDSVWYELRRQVALPGSNPLLRPILAALSLG